MSEVGVEVGVIMAGGEDFGVCVEIGELSVAGRGSEDWQRGW